MSGSFLEALIYQFDKFIRVLQFREMSTFIEFYYFTIWDVFPYGGVFRFSMGIVLDAPY